MTGTLVAKAHLEAFPDKSVVVLEAREFCSGATGRNAGVGHFSSILALLY
jgi:glycine/D-amino acid oxidase-like deaminating enzyme